MDIDNRVSCRSCNFLGQWWYPSATNQKSARITLHIPNIWKGAVETQNKHLGIRNHGYTPPTAKELDDDGYIDQFVITLIDIYLNERICIERQHQRLKLFKNRSRCRPNCCCYRASCLMLYPDYWEDVRKDNPINAPRLA